MLAPILTALGLLIYGIYRGTRRWGLAMLWYVAAAVTALDAAGMIAERLWGPNYSWNFNNHRSLLADSGWFLFYLGMALWSRIHHPPRAQ